MARVTVSQLWFYKGQWIGEVTLDAKKVYGITSGLEIKNKVSSSFQAFQANREIAFRGTEIKGEGFILYPLEAKSLIAKDTRNSQVISPFLTGRDIGSIPDQAPSRMVINFQDLDYAAASSYFKLFSIVTEKVKPLRDSITKQIHETAYWKFWDKRLDCYKRISLMERVLVRAEVSNTHGITFSPTKVVFSNKIIVFSLCDFHAFTLLQSSLHEEWARFAGGAPLRTDMCYSVKSCFKTFPFPTPNPSNLSTQFPTLNPIGDRYYTHRQTIMRDRQEGLTKTYNRFHNPTETAPDIAKLRSLHIEMDQAVAIAYGWQDLDLGHGFHQTKQGIRYTLSETARREVRDRLLALNHQRYSEEVAQGLHDKKKGKGKKGNPKVKAIKEEETEQQGELF